MFWWMNTVSRLASISNKHPMLLITMIKSEDIEDVKLQHFPEGTVDQCQQSQVSNMAFSHTSVYTWGRPTVYGSWSGQVQIPRGNQRRLWQLSVRQCLHPPRYLHSVPGGKKAFSVYWLNLGYTRNHFTVQSAVQTAYFLKFLLALVLTNICWH